MILDELVAASRQRLVEARAREPLQALYERLASAPPGGPSLLEAVQKPGVSLIAEVKRASPSRGPLKESLDPARQALRYARAGADAISVLTEPTRFHGSLADLAAAHNALEEHNLAVPLLRKDFIVDAYQLLEARLAGASAVLLIAAAVDLAALVGLYHQALELGLTPLVEVHSAKEIRAIRSLEPGLVGINNRDLSTFEVDLETSRRLRPLLPAGTLVIAESGIAAPQQVRRLAAAGIDGVLVGEALVTAADTEQLIGALKEAGR